MDALSQTVVDRLATRFGVEPDTVALLVECIADVTAALDALNPDWDQPSIEVAAAGAALAASPSGDYRCACGWAPPSASDCPEIQHQFHRQNCQATWSKARSAA